MSCQVCGKNSCMSSFHPFEEQQEHDEKYGKYENKIDELKDKIKQLEKQIAIMMDYISSEDWEKIDKKL